MAAALMPVRLEAISSQAAEEDLLPIKVVAHYSIAVDKSDLSRVAADYLLDEVQKAVAARGRARIALSGGSTPRELFARLADRADRYYDAMPWSAVEIFWVDERCVAPTDPESNFRMTRESLLDHLPISPNQVFRMEGEVEPELAASRYESLLRNHFRLEGAEAPAFDVVMLGLGVDGHTASIFPNTAAIYEFGRLVVANHVPQKNTWRITLTWSVINQARNVFFLIAGADKAEPLRALVKGPYNPDLLPSQLIRPANRRLALLCDRDAAQLTLPESCGEIEIA